MKFGTAFERVRKGSSMRLPSWSESVVVRANIPLDNTEDQEQYLYYDDGLNVFRWSPTNEELFSEDWDTTD